MTLDAFLKIANFQTLLFSIGAIISLLKFNTRELYIKLLGISLLLSVVGDLSSYALHHIGVGSSANYAASIYNLISYPIITSIYFISIGKKHPRSFVIINIIFLTVGIVNVLFFQKSTINTYTLILESVITIVLALYYFYWLLRELPTSQLQRLPMFWINSAFIIYFSGNLFLFLFTSYLVNVLNNNLLVYWTLHNVLGIIETLMIIVAVWMDLQNTKSRS